MGITREQVFMRAGVIRIVNRITNRAYVEREEQIWRNDLESAPHGMPWHTSFHASSFPGDDHTACGRKAVYGLMNVPKPAPTSRFLRSVADSGKAIEDELVGRWGEAGYLLSADAESEYQTGFTDKEHWLTGNMDAAVLPYKWTRPHIVEVKSKAHDKVLEMQRLQRGPDPAHRRQCLTYIGFAHEYHPFRQVAVCRETWRIAHPKKHVRGGICRVHNSIKCVDIISLDRCIDGSIYYVSRDDPSVTHEFTFTYDPSFMEAGREKLEEWRELYKLNLLPDRPRHKDGKVVGWSELPCKFCDLKKHVCKPDYQQHITMLSNSNALDFSQGIWPDYDNQDTRQKVLERWKQS
jgi:hypothetical protein